jgi:hypothetical protein
MNDRYRISESDPAETSRGALRPLLWLGLILSAVTNAVVSSAVGNPAVASAFGAVALAFATALVVHHYRNRAR